MLLNFGQIGTSLRRLRALPRITDTFSRRSSLGMRLLNLADFNVAYAGFHFSADPATGAVAILAAHLVVGIIIEEPKLKSGVEITIERKLAGLKNER